VVCARPGAEGWTTAICGAAQATAAGLAEYVTVDWALALHEIAVVLCVGPLLLRVADCHVDHFLSGRALWRGCCALNGVSWAALIGEEFVPTVGLPVMSPAALSQFRREIAVGVEAAARGVELAQSRVGSEDISAKDGRDIVTATDVAVEELIRSVLHESLGQGVIGEEHGGSRPKDGSGYWLVDPICGTRNYASGMSLYCVNLAYVSGQEVVAAVAADPSRAEIVLAERGRGAWVLRGGHLDRITTSDHSQIVVVEDGKSKGRRRSQAAAFSAAVIRADRWDFRSLGTTLALPYLAAGRIAAYAPFLVSAVHSAAGSLLTTEAGGVVTNLDGGRWTIDSEAMLATANQALHDHLLELAAAHHPAVP
jgi:myo-inositol-1(or 4)-monophosphatase